jgi:hypothetical protein
MADTNVNIDQAKLHQEVINELKERQAMKAVMDSVTVTDGLGNFEGNNVILKRTPEGVKVTPLLEFCPCENLHDAMDNLKARVDNTDEVNNVILKKIQEMLETTKDVQEMRKAELEQHKELNSILMKFFNKMFPEPIAVPVSVSSMPAVTPAKTGWFS